ncbi:MAG: amidohydrolase family protein [Gemmatimonadota bacterium]|nr:amidohydrolase family protein [Gemmatimonadota bacterium]
MNRRLSLSSALAAATLLSPSLAPLAGQAGDLPVTAFEAVNVVPMDSERVLSNQTVVVVGDRIMDVGPAAEVDVPAGAARIDGAGKYLMPGLAEMHGHTVGGNASEEFRRQVMFLYAANGVTTVRGMLGLAGDLELKAMTNTGEIWGPTLYLAGPSFNGNTVTSPEQGAARVWEQKNEGWDHLKIHPGLTRPQYDAIARAAGQAGIRFGGHVPADVGVVHAIKMGQETFDHIDGYLQYTGGMNGAIDEGRARELIDLTIGAGAWVVPTMVLWERAVIGLGDPDELAALPEMRYWPSQGVQNWANGMRNSQSQPSWDAETAMAHAENRKRMLGMMSDAGVGILMGTDSPQMFSVPGFSLHREMESMVESGMSPYEVLVSGTRNVGTYFQAYDTFGTVAPGRRADLILTNSNPLDDVANVADRAGVMIRGVWKSEAEIRQELDAIATSFGNE